MKLDGAQFVQLESIKRYSDACKESKSCVIVQGSAPVTLKIGERSPALAALHAAADVACSAFVTAWNPLSERTDDEANAREQQALATALRERGLAFVDGVGRHPLHRWQEPSFFVLGMPLDVAREMGARFRQNAIVWSGDDAVPQLILLR